MAAAALLFRSFVVWGMKDYNMVVNQLINFLDVYAMGMGAAILYVKLTTLCPEDKAETAGIQRSQRCFNGSLCKLLGSLYAPRGKYLVRMVVVLMSMVVTAKAFMMIMLMFVMVLVLVIMMMFVMVLIVVSALSWLSSRCFMLSISSRQTSAI